VKALESFERPGTDHPTTQRHILGAAFLQVYIAVQSPLKWVVCHCSAGTCWIHVLCHL